MALHVAGLLAGLVVTVVASPFQCMVELEAASASKLQGTPQTIWDTHMCPAKLREA